MKWTDIDRSLRNAIARLSSNANYLARALDDYQYVVSAAKFRWPGEPEKAAKEEEVCRKSLERIYEAFSADFKKIQEEFPKYE